MNKKSPDFYFFVGEGKGNNEQTIKIIESRIMKFWYNDSYGVREFYKMFFKNQSE